MKFSTMIPVKRNDGSTVRPEEFGGLVRLFWNAFGGCTVDAIADGYWKDDTGKLFVDKVRRLTVVVENNSQANLDYARLLVRRVGVQLGQKVMYFEHDSQGANAVEFIDIDPEESFFTLPEGATHLRLNAMTITERDEREEQRLADRLQSEHSAAEAWKKAHAAEATAQAAAEAWGVAKTQAAEATATEARSQAPS